MTYIPVDFFTASLNEAVNEGRSSALGECETGCAGGMDESVVKIVTEDFQHFRYFHDSRERVARAQKVS